MRSLLSIVTLVLLSACGQPDSEPVLVGWEWTELSSLPEVRWGMPATVLEDGTWLAVGGSTWPVGDGTMDTMWSWDPVADAWSSEGPIEPLPRYCHCAVTLPGRDAVLVMGGRDDDRSVPDAWVLDLDNGEWLMVDGGPFEGPIGCHAAWLDGRAWVFGGGNEMGNSAVMWSYDPDSNVMSEVDLPTVPSARRDAMSVVAGDRWLLFGGQTTATGFVNDLWSFDGVTWAELDDDTPLQARRYGTSAWHPEHDAWLVHGGTDNTQDFSDTWMLDTTTLEWTELELEGGPEQRSFATSGYDGTGLVVSGGLRLASSTALDDVWRLDPIVE